jgi:16S rRNA (guanine966-N2)-methyltransferase
MGLRIIGGEKKGKKLLSVKGMKTRPTTDRMREALFNILSARIADSNVLDLFAGTGALGIEALSRGASSAIFVDKDGDALSVIEKNIQSCGFEDRSKIFRCNILVNLKCLRTVARPFDIVFMDPPYEKDCVCKSLVNLKKSSALQKGSIIIVEHSLKEPVPEDLFGFEIFDQRRYGRTLFSFFNFITSTNKG